MDSDKRRIAVMKPGRWLLTLGMALVWTSPVLGWGRLSEVGTSAAPWLVQPSSARLLAMGGAGTADTFGSDAWWWNPAATAGFPGLDAQVAVRRHFVDTEMGFLTVAAPTPWGVPTLGFTYVRTDNIMGYDASGTETGLFNTSDLAAKLGWAYAWQNLQFGFALTYLQQDFHVAQSRGFGGDVGVLYTIRDNLRLGVSALRLGYTQEQDPLPMEVRLGAGAEVLRNLRFNLDIASPRDGEAYLAGGTEWRPFDPLALRLGWRTGPASSWQLGTLAYFSAGAGVNFGAFSLDYAFEPAGVLGNSHHVSLAYHYRPPPEGAVKPALRKPSDENLKVMPRAYEGRMVFIPQSVAKKYQAKSIQFQIKDEAGKIVRTFNFAGTAVPRQLVWDGKDSAGRRVDQDKVYSFDLRFVTAEGVKTEGLNWPSTQPARKLHFSKGGDGVEPEVLFQFEGDRSRVKSYQLRIFDRATGQTVRVLQGNQGLPERLEWDGRDANRAWAPARHKYAYRLELLAKDYTRVIMEHPILAVPAEVISRKPGSVKFKIKEILFDFARASIRAEMADKILKAAEIVLRRGPVIRVINGHADEVGTPSANIKISRDRAEAVRGFLKNQGVPQAEAIPVVGYGNERLLVIGGNEKIREKNRRVEIVMEVPAEPAK